MRRLMMLATLCALVLATLVSAQTATSPNGGSHAKKITISGQIKDDGTAIVAGGRAWLVSNVEKLRSHLGESVTIKGLLDPVTNRIEVLSMKVTRNDVSASARLGDSAFRR